MRGILISLILTVLLFAQEQPADRFLIIQDGKHGFINARGEVVIEPRFHECGHFHEGLARFRKVDKWGFIDLNGNIVIPAQYDEALDFSEGLAAVRKGKFWGFIDHQDSLVIPFMYTKALSFKEGLAPVKMGEKLLFMWINRGFGYINKKMKWLSRRLIPLPTLFLKGWLRSATQRNCSI